jgi:hypothetical protein
MKQSTFYYLLRRGLFMGGGGIWAKYVNDFKARVIADGGTMESPSCAKTDVKFLVQNPEPVAFTGLLNDYSGAAAAYSLRLLDNTYTGDAIVVRRSSDNATQAIGFVNNELDTTSLESFCIGTDGFVTTWYDQSGNSVNATQSVAGYQPKIVSSGSTITESGKPAVDFDGVDDHIDTGGSDITFTGAFHMFYLSKVKVEGGNVFMTYGGGGLDQIRLYDYLYRPYIDGTDYPSGMTNNGHLIRYVWEFSRDASNDLRNYRNGDQSGLSSGVPIAGNTTNTWSVASISASAIAFNGPIQEVIFYASDQVTNSNRVGINTNINDFYTIY